MGIIQSWRGSTASPDAGQKPHREHVEEGHRWYALGGNVHLIWYINSRPTSSASWAWAGSEAGGLRKVWPYSTTTGTADQPLPGCRGARAVLDHAKRLARTDQIETRAAR
jgi:hypothetical protein